MGRRLTSCAVLCALLLAAPDALADRVALLPARGGTDDAARQSTQADIARGLAALGHTVVPDGEVAAALGAVDDGAADTADEFRRIGGAVRADWVLVGVVEPAVTTTRLELTACLVPNGRVESVARELSRGKAPQETQEMLAVLVRPEGVGIGELPWERPAAAAPKPAQPPKPAQVAGPPAQPQTPPPPEAPPDGLVRMDYMSERHAVWPPYAAGKRFFVAALQGFSFAAATPEGARGSAGALQAGGRLGYAVGDAGFEILADVGGNLIGPPALWVDAGLRLMLTPSVHPVGGQLHGASIHMGPEITIGGFFRDTAAELAGPGGTYSSSIAVDPIFGAAFNFVIGITPAFQVEAQIGNLRWIPTGDGSLLLLGATLGAQLRI